ncbi:AAA family ATPase [Sphingobacterium sp. SG20118]|uniref:AAA family ATPase n=1 Tax=Sphingobacterium sp. SG20118 TaxID=3367156 RepID=UPI0037DFC061
MTGFRLFSITLETKTVITNKINLIENLDNIEDNYFSLIVGNNGTGKSRILSKITRFFNDLNLDTHRNFQFNDQLFEYNKLPSKIIAITNSISDKFPIDQGFRRSSRATHPTKHKDFIYNYLGTRNTLNSFSNRALMNRALEIVFENYSELDVSRSYRHIFDYLNYEPVIKLNYKFKNIFFKDSQEMTPDFLVDYAYHKMRPSYYTNDRLIEEIKLRANEICNFLTQKVLYDNMSENEITINFSEKNIGRMKDDNSLYFNNVNEYEIINLLKKMDLIRNVEIQVFKKGGFAFNFRDASSGEANILSTLLSLIPLLKDNSLILIDEPEISLHPQWQVKYIDLLNKILEKVKGCHVIIASHSPFLASDLKPDNSSVISLKNKKGIIYSNTIDNSTYGWSAEDILLNVFEMQTTRNNKLYQSISKALILLSQDDRSYEELRSIQNTLKEFYDSILESDPIKSIIKAIINAS